MYHPGTSYFDSWPSMNCCVTSKPSSAGLWPIPCQLGQRLQFKVSWPPRCGFQPHPLTQQSLVCTTCICFLKHNIWIMDIYIPISGLQGDRFETTWLGPLGKAPLDQASGGCSHPVSYFSCTFRSRFNSRGFQLARIFDAIQHHEF